MHSGHSGGQSANAKLTPPGTWQTVPNQRFASGAGAVPSYPDGFSLLPQQPLCAPNRSLLQLRDRRSEGLPCSRSWLSASLGGGSAASRRLPDPIGHCSPTKDPGLEGNLSDDGNSNEACANDPGYWTVMFMTKGGDRVGHSRVMAPRGKGPLTFEEVVGVIVEHASLLNLTVAYITYLGRDASIYTLLTPRTVQKRMDSFCVVVESKEDNPDLPSTRRQGKGTGVSGGELVVAEDCNEMQGLVGMATTANIMDEYRRSPRPTLPLKSGTPGGGLFRNVPSLTGLWQQQRHWSGLRTQSEKAREMQESWEMALTLLGKEEEGERKAIALDESSSWITLKVVEDRHAKALRKAERLRSHVIPLEPSRPYSATPKVWGGEGDEKKKDTRTEDKLQQPERAASVAAQKSLLCGVICGYKWRALPSEVRPQIKEAVAQDIACRLDVPRANITTDEYYGDSLIVQTAVEHDGTRTDAELQRSIATNDPTVNKTVQHKQSEDGFESKSQAKPCEKANLGPELDVDSILAPPTKDKQIATEPPPEPQKLHDLEQYNMKAKNEMTPTESARNYLRNRLNSLKDTMRRLEKEDGTHMLMALRRLEATTNKRNRDTKRKHLGNLYERTPKHADQTSTGNTMEEAPPQPLKHERQTTLNKITDEEPTEPAEDAEKAAPPLHSTEDIVPADTERELSEPAEDAEEEAAPPLHSTEDIVPADTERELSEPAEDAEKEAAPPLHSTEDIVPADTERDLSEPAEDAKKYVELLMATEELTTEARPLDVSVGSALLSDSATVTAPADRDATALMATDELTTEARPLDVTVGSALLSDSAAATAPADRDAAALMATDELTTEARPLDVTVGSALLSDSAAVTAPADRDAAALMATEESTFVRGPMSVSVGMGTVCDLCGGLAADVTPLHVLSSVDGGEGVTNSRVLSAARAVVVKKSNTREMGIAPGVLESDVVANALRRPLVELSGVEEVAAVEWRKGVSGKNRPSVVSLAAPSPSSERRVFTDVYPDRSFIPGSDVRRMVLVGKARVQNLTSATFDRAFDGSARGTRAMEEGVEAPRPLPLLSAVGEGVGGGRRAASQSAKQPAAASAPADGVPRRGVRFASFALAPTPPPSSEQRRPVRIQRQYDAYQGTVPSWSDPAVLLPRPVLRLRPERVSPAKMQSSKLPPVRQQQEGSHPYHNNKNVQQHLTPRGAANTLVQRPTGEAAPSVSHRRLAEVVTRLATSRTSSPQLHAQQSIYSLLPAVRTSPDQRDALYRQRRRRGSVSHARMGPTAAGPPTHMSFRNAPWGPALVSTWAHPMPRSTNGASQTGRFVGDRNVFYY